MLPGFGVALHVVHGRREAVSQPVAQAVEAVCLRRRRDAGQSKAQRESVLFEARFKRIHVAYSTPPSLRCRQRRIV